MPFPAFFRRKFSVNKMKEIQYFVVYFTSLAFSVRYSTEKRVQQ